MELDQPRPTPVPIVRALVPDAAGRILLLKRAHTGHGEGRWCLPGGKIDYGATVEQALAQELAEETGLQLTAAQFLFLQNSLPLQSGGMHCINLYFVCQTRGEVRLNRESSAIAWITAAEADAYDIAFRNDEAVRRYFSGGA